MAEKFVGSGWELNFATMEGEIPAARMTLETLERPGVHGYGYRLTGRKGREGPLVTCVDVVDAAAADAGHAAYANVIGEGVTVYQGPFATRSVILKDVEVKRIPIRGSVGGLYDGSSPQFLLEATWTVQVPGALG